MLKINSVINQSIPTFKGNTDFSENNTRKSGRYQIVDIVDNGTTFTKTAVKNNGTKRISTFNSKYTKTHNPEDRYPFNVTLKNYCGMIQEWHNSPERHSIVVTIDGNTFLKDVLKNGTALYKQNGINIFKNGPVNPKSKLASRAEAYFKKLYKYILSGKPTLIM